MNSEIFRNLLLALNDSLRNPAMYLQVQYNEKTTQFKYYMNDYLPNGTINLRSTRTHECILVASPSVPVILVASKERTNFLQFIFNGTYVGETTLALNRKCIVLKDVYQNTENTPYEEVLFNLSVQDISASVLDFIGVYLELQAEGKLKNLYTQTITVYPERIISDFICTERTLK